MTIILQITLFTLGGIFILYLQRFLKNGLNFILLILFIAFSVVVFFPDILNTVASFFGIGRGVDLVFYLTIPIIAIITLRQSLAIKKNSEKITELTRNQTIDDFQKNRTDTDK